MDFISEKCPTAQTAQSHVCGIMFLACHQNAKAVILSRIITDSDTNILFLTNGKYTCHIKICKQKCQNYVSEFKFQQTVTDTLSDTDSDTYTIKFKASPSSLVEAVSVITFIIV